MKKILIATLIALSTTVAAASSVPLAAAVGGHNKVQVVEDSNQSSDVNTILSIVVIGAVIFGLSRKKF